MESGGGFKIITFTLPKYSLSMKNHFSDFLICKYLEIDAPDDNPNNRYSSYSTVQIIIHIKKFVTKNVFISGKNVKNYPIFYNKRILLSYLTGLLELIWSSSIRATDRRL